MRSGSTETCRLRWLEPEDAPPGAVGEQVDEAVRALPHVANALAQVAQIALLAHDAVVGDLQAHEAAGLKRTHQQITPPVGFNLFVLQGMTSRQITYIARHALPMFLLVDKRFGPKCELQVPPTPAPLPHSAAGLEG